MRKIITIGRQYGAGGSALGRRVAKELGIEYYDRDIILRTAAASSYLSPAQVREWDERVPKDIGLGQSLFNFYSHPLGDELWDAQVKAIRNMAEHESCVIVGRNADYILKEFDHVLRVFVHGNAEWRVLNMMELHPELSEEQVRANMKAADRARQNYCKYYTKQVYGHAANFDLTLNVGKLGLEKAVQLVLDASEGL